MGHSNAFCDSEFYYCYPLSAATIEDERDIMAFEPVDSRGAGLVAYLQRFAFPDEELGEMRTYLVRHKVTNELAGYFSLKAGMMTHGETVEEGRIEFDSSPGVELANFAVNKAFRDRHPIAKGLGKNIYRELVLEAIRRAAAIIGVSVVYLFALPDERLIANYESYGFSRLDVERERQVHARIKPRYDAQCVFMVMKLH